MPTLSFSSSKKYINSRVTYSYCHVSGQSHESSIDIDIEEGSELTQMLISKCIVNRWKRQGYKKGIANSIEVISIE